MTKILISSLFVMFAVVALAAPEQPCAVAVNGDTVCLSEKTYAVCSGSPGVYTTMECLGSSTCNDNMFGAVCS